MSASFVKKLIVLSVSPIKTMSKHLSEQWMTRACELALRGLYNATPNPRVGCVVLDSSGELAGEGFHAQAGGPHAEVVALAEAGARAQGGTAYVTLEPCHHHGKTGPCTEALIDAGVTSVVYGMADPNPLVAGKGLERLRAAGIGVFGPLLEHKARGLNPGFIKRMTEGLPYVRCKMAMSLDGRTAMASGESKWITGPEARHQVQQLRARSCAIVTGVGTVLKDDPSLTVRDPLFGDNPRQPLRVVVDSRLRTPNSARLFQEPGSTLLVASDPMPAELAKKSGHTVWQLPSAASEVDLRALLGKLAEAGCNEVLLEAGPTLAGSFLRQDLFDELTLFMAPKIMGSTARALFELPLEELADAPQLRIEEITAVGSDWCIRAVPQQPQV